MIEVSIKSIQQAVEGLHDCKATYRKKTHISEIYDGELVWEGYVYIFDLEDHPATRIAYAWSSSVEGSSKRRFYAVLHEGLVKSAQDAVKASILTNYRGE